MRQIIFSDPVKLSPDSFDQHEKAGLRFLACADDLEDHYYDQAQLLVPENELAQRLTALPHEQLVLMQYYVLTDGSDLLKTAAHQALALQALQRQRAPLPDNYPAPYGPETENPFSWAVNGLIAPELARLTPALKTLGIDETRVGIELETTTTTLPLVPNDLWKQVQRAALADLKRQASAAKEPEKSALIAKRTAVAAFNAREMMMYDIVERDPRTRAIVEPIFGTKHGDKGYYDAKDILELQTKHAPAAIARTNHRTLLNVLYEKATAYGLVLNRPAYHINFSFWKEGRNLFETSHPEFLTTGKTIIEGIVKTLYDCFPLQTFPWLMKNKLNLSYRLTNNRENFLRLAQGRLEVRFTQPATHQDPEILLPIVMAGAAYGLTQQRAPHAQTANNDVLPATRVRQGVFERLDDRAPKITLHVLNGSVILENGRLKPPKGYLRHQASRIAEELGMLDAPAVESLSPFMNFMPPEDPAYLPYLIDFFEATRISPSGEILWPDVGSDAPPEAKNPPDCDGLRRTLRCKDIVAALIVDPGYDLNDTSKVTFDRRISSYVSARRERMRTCAALKQMTSPAFRQALNETLDRAYGLPWVAQEEKDKIRQDLATPGWSYVELINHYRLILDGFTEESKKAFIRAFNEVQAEILAPYPQNADASLTANPSNHTPEIFIFATPEVYQERLGHKPPPHLRSTWTAVDRIDYT